MGSTLLTLAACGPAPTDAPAEPTPLPTPAPGPTPHPASAATAEALRLYPALGKKESPFNQLFLQTYEQEKKAHPALLTTPDWPLVLARRVAEHLGTRPVATTALNTNRLERPAGPGTPTAPNMSAPYPGTSHSGPRR